MDWRTALTIGHVIGTVLGVGAATMAEIFYWKFTKDGVVDPLEKDVMKVTIMILRLGLALLVISGFGFLLNLRLMDRSVILTSPRLWLKIILTAILVFNALLMQSRSLPHWLGNAISLTSWYGALILGTWRVSKVTYWSGGLTYVAAIVVVAGLMWWAHHSRRLKPSP